MVLETAKNPIVYVPLCLLISAVVAGAAYAYYYAGRRHFLKPGKRLSVSILDKTYISPDTFRLRLKLPTTAHCLGLPVGQHIKVFCRNYDGSEPGKWNGKQDMEAGTTEVCRKYTPTYDGNGYFDLVVKVYKPNKTFVDGGKMSRHIDSLQVEDELEIEGPVGMLEYHGKGVFSVSSMKNKPVTTINLIAGGTGITPIIRLVEAVFKEPGKRIKMALLFCNQTEDDILLRGYLEALQAQHPQQLKIWYTIDKAPSSAWKYSQGYVNEEMIKDHLYNDTANDDIVTIICGRRPMNMACRQSLLNLGHSEGALLKF
eukprot:GHVU01156813.1.p1 GENE.GHVU01156813.1~~GHVU01156813.1.p1  ORF type:complete len:314 (-),score=32.34 GHVU01156813.1:2014-2955(-)